MDQLVFALKPSDDYLHVGTAASVLAHYDPAVVADTGPNGLALLEFYTADGAALAVERSCGKATLVAAPADPATTPELLVDRIALLLARLQVAFDRSDNDTLAASRVPHLQGPLPVVVAALAAWFEPLPPFDSQGGPTPGGPWHTAMHKVGLAHVFG